MSILKLNDSNTLYDHAQLLFKKGRIKDAAILIEKISEKSLKHYLTLLECYEILKYQEGKIYILSKIIELKPQKIYYSALIKELKKIKKYAKAFHFCLKAQKNFPKDPDFKKEILEILIKKQKYRFALQFLKQQKPYFCQEKNLFYKGYLLRETGKTIKAYFIFKKMVKKYPFNLLYRYLLSTIYQSLKLTTKSEEQLIFIRDFLKQIPKLIRLNDQSDPFTFLMQNLSEEI